MSDDFVKSFIENGGSAKREVIPSIESPEGKENTKKFFDELDKVGGSMGFIKFDDMQGMVAMALLTSYIAHHGTNDERRRFSAIMNCFVAGFPELERYMERIILLTMFCSIENGAVTLNDVFSMIPGINPEVLDMEESKKDIVEEFAKRIIEKVKSGGQNP